MKRNHRKRHFLKQSFVAWIAALGLLAGTVPAVCEVIPTAENTDAGTVSFQFTHQNAQELIVNFSAEEGMLEHADAVLTYQDSSMEEPVSMSILPSADGSYTLYQYDAPVEQITGTFTLSMITAPGYRLNAGGNVWNIGGQPLEDGGQITLNDSSIAAESLLAIEKAPAEEAVPGTSDQPAVESPVQDAPAAENGTPVLPSEEQTDAVPPVLPSEAQTDAAAPVLPSEEQTDTAVPALPSAEDTAVSAQPIVPETIPDRMDASPADVTAIVPETISAPAEEVQAFEGTERPSAPLDSVAIRPEIIAAAGQTSSLSEAVSQPDPTMNPATAAASTSTIKSLLRMRTAERVPLILAVLLVIITTLILVNELLSLRGEARRKRYAG